MNVNERNLNDETIDLLRDQLVNKELDWTNEINCRLDLITSRLQWNPNLGD